MLFPDNNFAFTWRNRQWKCIITFIKLCSCNITFNLERPIFRVRGITEFKVHKHVSFLFFCKCCLWWPVVCVRDKGDLREPNPYLCKKKSKVWRKFRKTSSDWTRTKHFPSTSFNCRISQSLVESFNFIVMGVLVANFYNWIVLTVLFYRSIFTMVVTVYYNDFYKLGCRNSVSIFLWRYLFFPFLNILNYWLNELQRRTDSP